MRSLIVDANIIVGAAMGRSLPLIVEMSSRALLMVPVPQLIETRSVVFRKAGDGAARRLDDMVEIVQPIDIAVFAHLEHEARDRLDTGGQSDWPVLAAALSLNADIWSRDIDLFGTGVAVWSTRNISHFPAASPLSADQL